MTDYQRAYEIGRGIDLSGAVYGPSHNHGGFAARPSTHYPFLAGLVASEGLSHALEIGTHYGGSAMAIAAGGLSGLLVSVDVVEVPGRVLPLCATCIIADALSTDTARRIGGWLGPEGVFGRCDLAFFDAGHDYAQTHETIAIYANRLKPRFIVIDDIYLNASMTRLWDCLKDIPGAYAADVSFLIGRPTGLGVLEPDYSVFALQEMPAWEREIKRRIWRARARLCRLVPRKARRAIRQWGRGGDVRVKLPTK